MIELKIVFDPATNQMTITGPIEQKVLSYGMLDMARDLVQAFDPTKQSQILAPTMPIGAR